MDHTCHEETVAAATWHRLGSRDKKLEKPLCAQSGRCRKRSRKRLCDGGGWQSTSLDLFPWFSHEFLLRSTTCGGRVVLEFCNIDQRYHKGPTQIKTSESGLQTHAFPVHFDTFCTFRIYHYCWGWWTWLWSCGLCGSTNEGQIERMHGMPWTTSHDEVYR